MVPNRATHHKYKMTSMKNPIFSFSFVSLKETIDGVKISNPKKASQASDIPLKKRKRSCIILRFS